jgi:hypothetical protein
VPLAAGFDELFCLGLVPLAAGYDDVESSDDDQTPCSLCRVGDLGLRACGLCSILEKERVILARHPIPLVSTSSAAAMILSECGFLANTGDPPVSTTSQ